VRTDGGGVKRPSTVLAEISTSEVLVSVMSSSVALIGVK
jgi:hypothetical protein